MSARSRRQDANQPKCEKIHQCATPFLKPETTGAIRTFDHQRFNAKKLVHDVVDRLLAKGPVGFDGVDLSPDLALKGIGRLQRIRLGEQLLSNRIQRGPLDPIAHGIRRGGHANVCAAPTISSDNRRFSGGVSRK